jgi:hypothetical protein
VITRSYDVSHHLVNNVCNIKCLSIGGYMLEFMVFMILVFVILK